MPAIRALKPWLKSRWTDPVAWTDSFQLVKTVIAAVAAWMIAIHVFSLPQAFLAPWAALLVVHSTVYRTFHEGMQQVGATVVGVTLAWAVGNSLGLDWIALSVLMLAALFVGKIAALRLDGTDIAATAVIVLTIGYSDDGQLLLLRFLDTAVGIGVGLLVNLVVWPPLRDYSAARAMDGVNEQVGTLLWDMSRQLRERCGSEVTQEWVDRTRDIDEDLDRAWGLLRQASESGRFNPRRGAGAVRQTEQFDDLLRRMEQAIADIASMSRTLGHSISRMQEWDDTFRERWFDLLEDAAGAIAEPDSQRVAGVRLGLADLADDLSTDKLSARHWPEYGALIVNLRNIVTSMDRVAASNPVTSAAVTGTPRVLRR
ncbi:MAG TPA: aromatic acid exporter family protein [Nocardioidaceae bacterium]|nr:aromatic acid exporter family protein [Nocardioidaceae bacterium]